MVRILLMGLSAKRRLNSSPIWRNRRTSIWWFKKLSTFNILPAFYNAVLYDTFFQKIHTVLSPRFLLILLYRSGTGMSIRMSIGKRVCPVKLLSKEKSRSPPVSVMDMLPI